MESLPAVAKGDDVHGFGHPIATLQMLLDATLTHAGVPDETRRSLDEMAACVRDLSELRTRLVQATTASPAAGRSTPALDAGGVAADLRGKGLREFVGADLIDQLGQGPAANADTEAGPSEPMTERARLQQRPTRPRLTPQEQRILDLIAEGCTNRQIAGELYLAEKTVKNYVSNMLRKLGMERRTQAAVYAAHLHRAPLAAASGTIA